MGNVTEIEKAGLTHKMGINRKTVHTHTIKFKGDFGQVRDRIIKAKEHGYFEPYTNLTLE